MVSDLALATQSNAGMAPRAVPELSIVVPLSGTTHVAVCGLVERTRDALDGQSWEIVLVDDNAPEATIAALRAIVAGEPRIRHVRRVGRNGLTQTCLVAMLASGAPYVAMIEPNAATDEKLLPAMQDRLRNDEADLIVAARRCGASNPLRAFGRAVLSAATRRALSTAMSDPTSGFFMMRRTSLEQLTPLLSSLGRQVLLDLVATAHGRLRVVELASAGADAGRRQSELTLALELFALMIAKLSGDAVSIRFLLFCLVGFSGVGVHLAILDLALLATLAFPAAQTTATIGAMIWNFTLNNAVTYGDQRLTGVAYLTGLVRFMVICGIGAVSNIGVASWIYAHDTTWWIAGLGGAVMGAVWNYAVSSVLVWRPR